MSDKVLIVKGNTHHKTLNGDEKRNELKAKDKAHYNTFNGNEGNDVISAWDDVHNNTFNGNEGDDLISAWGNAHNNTFNGNDGDDTTSVYSTASRNIFSGNKGDDGFTVSQDANNNTLNGNEGNDVLGTTHNAHNNTFNGDEGNDELYAKNQSSHNILNGNGENDKIYIENNAHHSTLSGNEGDDILKATHDADYNILNGDEGDDELYTEGRTSHNTLNGNEGSDVLQAKAHSHKNTLNGNAGIDKLIVRDAFDNILNGNKGSDTLLAFNNANHNILSGNEGNDTLFAQKGTHNNTLNGNEGNDILMTSSAHNILNGGEENDVITSLRGGILSGKTGNDFILTYLPDGNLFSKKPLTMAGGAGRDVLIGSGLFWQAKKEGFESKVSSSWTFNGGSGDDIIMPYISLKKFYINYDFQKNINDFKQKITVSKIYKPSDKMRNTHYQITTGEGTDTIALSSMPAENVTTHVKDFNWNEDRLAFDGEDMAQAVLPKLALSKKFSAATTIFNYEGHQYMVSTPQQTQTPALPIHLKTITVDGEKIQYPDLGKKIVSSYDYTLYKSKPIAKALSRVSDPKQLNHSLFDGTFTKKTFSKTYTIDLNKDIFVMTKESLNLIPSEEGNFKVQLGDHLLNAVTSFRGRDLFTDEDKQTYLYQSLETDETLCFKSVSQKVPQNVVAVVVVQEKNNGLIFTTQPQGTTLPLPTTGQTVQTFTASDFFTKGHFARIGNSNHQNPSVTMKLGLILKGEKESQLITTPLGDKIQVKVGK